MVKKFDFVYLEFYDPVYTEGWTDKDLKIEDTIHSGVFILLEEGKEFVLVAMFGSRTSETYFTKFLVPRQLIRKFVTFKENIFTDRVLVNGFGGGSMVIGKAGEEIKKNTLLQYKD